MKNIFGSFNKSINFVLGLACLVSVPAFADNFDYSKNHCVEEQHEAPLNADLEWSQHLLADAVKTNPTYANAFNQLSQFLASPCRVEVRNRASCIYPGISRAYGYVDGEKIVACTALQATPEFFIFSAAYILSNHNCKAAYNTIHQVLPPSSYPPSTEIFDSVCSLNQK